MIQSRGGRTTEWGEQRNGRTVRGSTETELHSTHAMGHSLLLLLRPLLLLGSEQSLVLCKHGQLLDPAAAGILHSCFHLQETTGEGHSKGKFSQGVSSYVFYIVSPYVTTSLTLYQTVTTTLLPKCIFCPLQTAKREVGIQI